MKRSEIFERSRVRYSASKNEPQDSSKKRYPAVLLQGGSLSEQKAQSKIGTCFDEGERQLVEGAQKIALGGDGNFYVDEYFELNGFYPLGKLDNLEGAIEAVNQDPILRWCVERGLHDVLSLYTQTYLDDDIFSIVKSYGDISLATIGAILDNQRIRGKVLNLIVREDILNRELEAQGIGTEGIAALRANQKHISVDDQQRVHLVDSPAIEFYCSLLPGIEMLPDLLNYLAGFVILPAFGLITNKNAQKNLTITVSQLANGIRGSPRYRKIKHFYRQHKGMTILFALILMRGLFPIFGKMNVLKQDVYALVFWINLLAGILVLPSLFSIFPFIKPVYRGKPLEFIKSMPKKILLGIIGIGLLIQGIIFPLQLSSLGLVSESTYALFVQLQPIVVLVTGIFLFKMKSEKFTWKKISGTLIVAGSIVIYVFYHAAVGTDSIKGIMLLCAATILAAGAILSMKAITRRVDGFFAASIGIFTGIFAGIALMMVFSGGFIVVDFSKEFFIYTAISVCAYILYFKVLESIPASTASTLLSAAPLVTIFAVLLLRWSNPLAAVLCALFVLAGSRLLYKSDKQLIGLDYGMNEIDLHIHSHYSKGATYSPQQIIDEAIEKNIKAIAICDHHTFEGVLEALEYAADKDIEIIPARDILDESLAHGLKTIAVADVHSFNVGDEVLELACDKYVRVIPAVEIHTNENVHILVYFSDVDQYRRKREIIHGSVPEKEEISIQEAIDWAHRFGGVAVYAHPGRFNEPFNEEILVGLFEKGLDGSVSLHCALVPFSIEDLLRLGTSFSRNLSLSLRRAYGDTLGIRMKDVPNYLLYTLSIAAILLLVLIPASSAAGLAFVPVIVGMTKKTDQKNNLTVTIKRKKQQISRVAFVAALKKAKGNKFKAAEILGLSAREVARVIRDGDGDLKEKVKPIYVEQKRCILYWLRIKKGSLRATAKQIGVDKVTLRKWIAELEAEDEQFKEDMNGVYKNLLADLIRTMRKYYGLTEIMGRRSTQNRVGFAFKSLVDIFEERFPTFKRFFELYQGALTDRLKVFVLGGLANGETIASLGRQLGYSQTDGYHTFRWPLGRLLKADSDFASAVKEARSEKGRSSAGVQRAIMTYRVASRYLEALEHILCLSTDGECLKVSNGRNSRNATVDRQFVEDILIQPVKKTMETLNAYQIQLKRFRKKKDAQELLKEVVEKILILDNYQLNLRHSTRVDLKQYDEILKDAQDLADVLPHSLSNFTERDCSDQGVVLACALPLDLFLLVPVFGMIIAGNLRDSNRGLAKRIVEAKARYYYEMIGQGVDLERRNLVAQLASMTSIPNPIIFINDTVNIQVTRSCVTGCTHCQLAYKGKTRNMAWKQRKEMYRKILSSVQSFPEFTAVAIIGGNTLGFAQADVQFLMDEINLPLVLQINADVTKDLRMTLARMAFIGPCVMAKMKNDTDYEFCLSISFDSFHQDKLPISHVANIIEVAVRYMPKLPIQIRSVHEPGFDQRIQELVEELRRRELGPVHKVVETITLKDRQAQDIELPIIDEITFINGLKAGYTITVIRDFVNRVGYAELLGEDQYIRNWGTTEDFLSGIDTAYHWQPEYLYFDEDGNVYFYDILYSNFSMGNIIDEELSDILNRAKDDPITWVLEMKPSILLDLTQEVEPDFKERVKVCPHPYAIMYEILKSPARRLYLTKRLIQILFDERKNRLEGNFLENLGIPHQEEPLRVEYETNIAREREQILSLAGTSREEVVKAGVVLGCFLPDLFLLLPLVGMILDGYQNEDLEVLTKAFREAFERVLKPAVDSLYSSALAALFPLGITLSEKNGIPQKRIYEIAGNKDEFRGIVRSHVCQSIDSIALAVKSYLYNQKKERLAEATYSNIDRFDDSPLNFSGPSRQLIAFINNEICAPLNDLNNLLIICKAGTPDLQIYRLLALIFLINRANFVMQGLNEFESKEPQQLVYGTYGRTTVIQTFSLTKKILQYELGRILESVDGGNFRSQEIAQFRSEKILSGVQDDIPFAVLGPSLEAQIMERIHYQWNRLALGSLTEPIVPEQASPFEFEETLNHYRQHPRYRDFMRYLLARFLQKLEEESDEELETGYQRYGGQRLRDILVCPQKEALMIMLKASSNFDGQSREKILENLPVDPQFVLRALGALGLGVLILFILPLIGLDPQGGWNVTASFALIPLGAMVKKANDNDDQEEGLARYMRKKFVEINRALELVTTLGPLFKNDPDKVGALERLREEYKVLRDELQGLTDEIPFESKRDQTEDVDALRRLLKQLKEKIPKIDQLIVSADKKEDDELLTKLNQQKRELLWLKTRVQLKLSLLFLKKKLFSAALACIDGAYHNMQILINIEYYWMRVRQIKERKIINIDLSDWMHVLLDSVEIEGWTVDVKKNKAVRVALRPWVNRYVRLKTGEVRVYKIQKEIVVEVSSFEKAVRLAIHRYVNQTKEYMTLFDVAAHLKHTIKQLTERDQSISMAIHQEAAQMIERTKEWVERGVSDEARKTALPDLKRAEEYLKSGNYVKTVESLEAAIHKFKDRMDALQRMRAISLSQASDYLNKLRSRMTREEELKVAVELAQRSIKEDRFDWALGILQEIRKKHFSIEARVKDKQNSHIRQVNNRLTTAIVVAKTLKDEDATFKHYKTSLEDTLAIIRKFVSFPMDCDQERQVVQQDIRTVLQITRELIRQDKLDAAISICEEIQENYFPPNRRIANKDMSLVSVRLSFALMTLRRARTEDQPAKEQLIPAFENVISELDKPQSGPETLCILPLFPFLAFVSVLPYILGLFDLTFVSAITIPTHLAHLPALLCCPDGFDIFAQISTAGVLSLDSFLSHLLNFPGPDVFSQVLSISFNVSLVLFGMVARKRQIRSSDVVSSILKNAFGSNSSILQGIASPEKVKREFGNRINLAVKYALVLSLRETQGKDSMVFQSLREELTGAIDEARSKLGDNKTNPSKVQRIRTELEMIVMQDEELGKKSLFTRDERKELKSPKTSKSDDQDKSPIASGSTPDLVGMLRGLDRGQAQLPARTREFPIGVISSVKDIASLRINELVAILTYPGREEEVGHELLRRSESRPYEVSKPLVGALSDPNPECVEAARSLLLEISQSSPYEVSKPLVGALSDPNPERVKAAKSLLLKISQKSPYEVSKPLVKALANRNPTYVEMFILCLREIRAKNPGLYLSKMVEKKFGKTDNLPAQYAIVTGVRKVLEGISEELTEFNILKGKFIQNIQIVLQQIKTGKLNDGQTIEETRAALQGIAKNEKETVHPLLSEDLRGKCENSPSSRGGGSLVFFGFCVVILAGLGLLSIGYSGGFDHSTILTSLGVMKAMPLGLSGVIRTGPKSDRFPGRRRIRELTKKHHGHYADMAVELGVHFTTVYSYVLRYIGDDELSEKRRQFVKRCRQERSGKKPAREVIDLGRLSRSKIEAIYNNPPDTVKKPRLSKGWRQAGYGQMLKKINTLYGGWTEFLASLWTKADIEEQFNHPPKGIQDKRYRVNWVRVGYKDFVLAVKRLYGSWPDFLLSRGIQPMKKGARKTSSRKKTSRKKTKRNAKKRKRPSQLVREINELLAQKPVHLSDLGIHPRNRKILRRAQKREFYEDIGNSLNLSRERIRRILLEIKDAVKSVSTTAAACLVFLAALGLLYLFMTQAGAVSLAHLAGLGVVGIIKKAEEGKKGAKSMVKKDGLLKHYELTKVEVLNRLGDLNWDFNAFRREIGASSYFTHHELLIGLNISNEIKKVFLERFRTSALRIDQLGRSFGYYGIMSGYAFVSQIAQSLGVNLETQRKNIVQERGWLLGALGKTKSDILAELGDGWNLKEFEEKYSKYITNFVPRWDFFHGLAISAELRSKAMEHIQSGRLSLIPLGEAFGFSAKAAESFSVGLVNHFGINLERKAKELMRKSGYLLSMQEESRADFLRRMKEEGVIGNDVFNLYALREEALTIISAPYATHVDNIRGFDLLKTFKAFLRQQYVRRRGNFSILSEDFGIPRKNPNGVLKRLIKAYDPTLLDLNFHDDGQNGYFLCEKHSVTRDKVLALMESAKWNIPLFKSLVTAEGWVNESESYASLITGFDLQDEFNKKFAKRYKKYLGMMNYISPAFGFSLGKDGKLTKMFQTFRKEMNVETEGLEIDRTPGFLLRFLKVSKDKIILMLPVLWDLNAFRNEIYQTYGNQYPFIRKMNFGELIVGFDLLEEFHNAIVEKEEEILRRTSPKVVFYSDLARKFCVSDKEFERIIPIMSETMKKEAIMTSGSRLDERTEDCEASFQARRNSKINIWGTQNVYDDDDRYSASMMGDELGDSEDSYDEDDIEQEEPLEVDEEPLRVSYNSNGVGKKLGINNETMDFILKLLFGAGISEARFKRAAGSIVGLQELSNDIEERLAQWAVIFVARKLTDKLGLRDGNGLMGMRDDLIKNIEFDFEVIEANLTDPGQFSLKRAENTIIKLQSLVMLDHQHKTRCIDDAVRTKINRFQRIYMEEVKQRKDAGTPQANPCAYGVSTESGQMDKWAKGKTQEVVEDITENDRVYKYIPQWAVDALRDYPDVLELLRHKMIRLVKTASRKQTRAPPFPFLWFILATRFLVAVTVKGRGIKPGIYLPIGLISLLIEAGEIDLLKRILVHELAHLNGQQENIEESESLAKEVFAVWINEMNKGTEQEAPIQRLLDPSVSAKEKIPSLRELMRAQRGFDLTGLLFRYADPFLEETILASGIDFSSCRLDLILRCHSDNWQKAYREAKEDMTTDDSYPRKMWDLARIVCERVRQHFAIIGYP
ncbi:MAG: PHP domain-containing protein [Candidatus Omnitrophota bacterium]